MWIETFTFEDKNSTKVFRVFLKKDTHPGELHCTFIRQSKQDYFIEVG